MTKRKSKKHGYSEISTISSANCPYKFDTLVRDVKFDRESVYCVKFNQNYDGNIFAVAVMNRILIFDADGEMKLLQGHEMPQNENIYTMDWSRNSETNEMVLAAGGLGGALYDVFKLISFGEENFALENQKFNQGMADKREAINDIKFSPSCEYLFAAAGEWGRMYLCNIRTQTVIAEFHAHEFGLFPKQIIAVSFDPSGDYIACTGEMNVVSVWDLKRNQFFQKMLADSMNEQDPKSAFETQLIPSHFGCIVKNLHETFIDSIIWFGKFTLLTKSADGEIIIWHLKVIDENKFPIFLESNVEPNKLYSFKVPNCTYWFMRMTMNRDGNMLAIGTDKGEVLVYDLKVNSFEEIKSFKIATSENARVIRAITFSSDSKMVVYCSDDGAIFKHSLKDESVEEVEDEKVAESGPSSYCANDSMISDPSSPPLENSPKRLKLKLD